MTTALNDFYAFSTTPFGKSTPGPDLFPSRGHQEIQARLTFALQERLPALITGSNSRSGKLLGQILHFEPNLGRESAINPHLHAKKGQNSGDIPHDTFKTGIAG